MLALIFLIVSGLTTVACLIGALMDALAPPRSIPWKMLGYSIASLACFLFWLLI